MSVMELSCQCIVPIARAAIYWKACAISLTRKMNSRRSIDSCIGKRHTPEAYRRVAALTWEVEVQ